MDNRVLAAVGGLVALLGVGIAAFFVSSGGAPATPEPVENPAPDAAPVAKADAPPTHDAPGYRGEHDPDEAKPRDDGPVKPGEAEPDADYEQQVIENRKRREALNSEWRAESTANAQQWVAQSGLDEATGQQVMAIVNKAHDTIAQTRSDLEDGVIRPPEGRDEMKWAKEDVRVELANLLGEEKSQDLLDHLKTGNLGGF